MKMKSLANLTMASLVKTAMNGLTEGVLPVLKSKFIYTIDITYFRQCIDIAVFHKYFPGFPVHIHIDVESLETQYQVSSIPMNNYGLCRWHGTEIVLRGHVGGVPGESSKAVYFELMCLNRKKDINNLKKFFRHMVLETRKAWATERNDSMMLHTLAAAYGEQMKRKKRTFNDVFIPEETKKQITEAVDKFINSKPWYDKHSIPYHFGILLYGPPGTGKSSVVTAICNNWMSDMYVIETSQIKSIIERTTWLREYVGKPRIIVIEDIDTAGFSDKRVMLDTLKMTEHGAQVRSKEESIVSGKQLLGSFMNFMDGVRSIENVIYIFTTNYKETLDPALIRPGRIDLLVEIPYVTDETFNEFLKYHFDEGLPKGRHVVDGLTFATIQTNVMAGDDHDTIVEIYTTKEENA